MNLPGRRCPVEINSRTGLRKRWSWRSGFLGERRICSKRNEVLINDLWPLHGLKVVAIDFEIAFYEKSIPTGVIIFSHAVCRLDFYKYFRRSSYLDLQ